MIMNWNTRACFPYSIRRRNPFLTYNCIYFWLHIISFLRIISMIPCGNQTWRAGKWTIEIGDFPNKTYTFMGNFLMIKPGPGVISPQPKSQFPKAKCDFRTATWVRPQLVVFSATWTDRNCCDSTRKQRQLARNASSHMIHMLHMCNIYIRVIHRVNVT